MIVYYYGFEIRPTVKGIFVSRRNDSRFSDDIVFSTMGSAQIWIEKAVGLI